MQAGLNAALGGRAREFRPEAWGLGPEACPPSKRKEVLMA